MISRDIRIRKTLSLINVGVIPSRKNAIQSKCLYNVLWLQSHCGCILSNNFLFFFKKQKKSSNFFYSLPYEWDSLSITYGWGFTPQASYFPLSILYRNDNAAESSIVYNAVKFTFSSTESLPTSVAGNLKLNLGTNLHVLTNSLDYSLPSFNSDPIHC